MLIPTKCLGYLPCDLVWLSCLRISLSKSNVPCVDHLKVRLESRLDKTIPSSTATQQPPMPKFESSLVLKGCGSNNTLSEPHATLSYFPAPRARHAARRPTLLDSLETSAAPLWTPRGL